jgi:hypothetical protein
MFGCKEKMRREKEMRENKRREKDVKNRINLVY